MIMMYLDPARVKDQCSGWCKPHEINVTIHRLSSPWSDGSTINGPVSCWWVFQTVNIHPLRRMFARESISLVLLYI